MLTRPIVQDDTNDSMIKRLAERRDIILHSSEDVHNKTLEEDVGEAEKFKDLMSSNGYQGEGCEMNISQIKTGFDIHFTLQSEAI